MKRSTPTPRLAAPPTGDAAASPRPLLARARYRLHRVTVTALFVITLGFTLFMSTGTSQEATAVTNRTAVAAIGPEKCDFFPNQNQGWEPSSPGSSYDGFMYPSNHLTEGTAATPLEKYGMRGMDWSMTSYSGKLKDVDSDKDQNCQFMPAIHNMLAQETLNISQTIASVTIAVRQQASDASPFMEMIRDATPNANAALKKWFIPGAGAMVVLTGIWMVVKGSTGNRRNVIGGIGWMMFAVLIVAWLMMPTSLANGRDGSSCEGKECQMAFDGGTSPDGRDADETAIAKDDPNYYALTAKANDAGGDLANAATGMFAPRTTSEECNQAEGKEDAGARTLDCVLWYEMAFRPWAVGQFGSIGESKIDWTDPSSRDPKPPKAVIKGMDESKGATKDSKKYANAEKPEEGDDVRMIMLSAQTFSWQEGAATGKGQDVGGVFTGGKKETGSPNRISPDEDKDDHEIWDASTKNGLWNQVRAYMAGEEPGSYASWSGQEHTSDRTSTAFLSLIGNILIAAFVLVTSLLTVMWYAVVVIALMALPVVGLLSVYPPWQKFLRGLGQLWIKGLTLAGFFTFMQVGVGALTGTIMASNAAFGWKVVLMLAAVMGLFKVARLAREDAFTPNLGSQGVAEQADPQQAVNKVSPVMAGAGFAAGRGTARVAGKAAKRTGNAAGNKAKAGAVKVEKATQKGVDKGKQAAKKGGTRVVASRPGRAVGNWNDSMQGWASQHERDRDRDWTSQKKDRKTGEVNGRAARNWQHREDLRDQRDKQRAERKQSREKTAQALDAERKGSATKKRMSTAAARERLRNGGQRDEVEVDVAPAPSEPRVTRVSNKRPTRRPADDAGPTREPKRGTRRSQPAAGAGQPGPAAGRRNTPQGGGRTEQPKVQRTDAQPKVQRRDGRPGDRLSAAERKRLAQETALEVAKGEQKKADREAANRGGNRVQ